MIREELKEILSKHKVWLQGKGEGERANLQGADMRHADTQGANMRDADMRGANMQRANMRDADMRYADMQDANMRHADMRYADMRHADMQGADMQRADMQGANMQHANMRGADIRYADMRGADIDYSEWPMWCGSLKAHVDDRIAIQLLYHTLSVVQHSPYVSEEIKRTLLTPEVVEVANQFHRIDECGKLAGYSEEDVADE